MGILGLIFGISLSLAMAPTLTANAAQRPAPRTMLRLRLKFKRPLKIHHTKSSKHHKVIKHRHR